MNEVASVLNYKLGKVPFLYLGLPIGGNPRRLCLWDLIVTRIKYRWSGWNSRFLSFGGSLVLLKPVLTSLPIYVFSFFKAPSGIISSIESLFNKLLWGGGEDHRKISWIGWSSVWLQKEFGGLGVKQLKEFNVALLEKWCWRMLADKGDFWYRVLVARYGEVGGRLRAGVALHGGGRWWGLEMGAVVLGVAGLRSVWQRRWGMGLTRCFGLIDGWRRLLCVCDSVGCLSYMKTNPLLWQLCFLLVWSRGEAWMWRRRLWAREEEMLEGCRTLLLYLLLLQINGCGSLTHQRVTQFGVRIMFWLQKTHLLRT